MRSAAARFAPHTRLAQAAWLTLALLASACVREEEPACCAKPEPVAAGPITVNSAEAFATLWDATASLPEAERIAAFKADLTGRLPAFYGPARFDTPEQQDSLNQRIADSITAFPSIREAYLAKAAGFESQLARNVGTFRAAFPDFQLTAPIALVHSLGEMDGGTREQDGQTWLIFGVDGMVRYHPYADESAFFHHELFHTYHRLDDACLEVVCNLWTEGLAVYVADQLNPDAGDAELLLTIPENLVPGTQARLGEAFAHLGGVLESQDEAVMGALFSFSQDETGLPPRRGYYLGFLVATELAKGRTLTELARMPMSEGRPLIAEAVKTLANQP